MNVGNAKNAKQQLSAVLTRLDRAIKFLSREEELATATVEALTALNHLRRAGNIVDRRVEYHGKRN